MAELLPACLAWVLTTFAVYCFKCVKSRGTSIGYFLDNLQKIVNNDEKRWLAAKSAIPHAPPQTANKLKSFYPAAPPTGKILLASPVWKFCAARKIYTRSEVHSHCQKIFDFLTIF